MKILDYLGRVPAWLELIGFRFPVRAYERQVSETLWRGSRPDSKKLKELARRGFKAVIDLTAERVDDPTEVAMLGMCAVHVPILDNSSPTFAEIDQFLAVVRESAYQPSYVHCEAGVGRTGIAIACYRIAVEGWGGEKAITEAETFGTMMPNQIGFIRHFARRKP